MVRDDDVVLADNEVKSRLAILRGPWTGEYLADNPLAIDSLWPKGDWSVGDLEALAYGDGSTWLVGSHSRKRSCAVDADRERIVRLRDGASPVVFEGLLGVDRAAVATIDRCLGVFKDADLCAAIVEQEALGACATGLNIEGAMADATGLWLGLRGPVGPKGAWMVHGVPEKSGKLTVDRVVKVDFDAPLGIRELTPRGDEVLVIAGPPADADERPLPAFHVYLFDASELSQDAIAPRHRLEVPYGAEALIPSRSGASALVLFDGVEPVKDASDKACQTASRQLKVEIAAETPAR